MASWHLAAVIATLLTGINEKLGDEDKLEVMSQSKQVENKYELFLQYLLFFSPVAAPGQYPCYHKEGSPLQSV